MEIELTDVFILFNFQGFERNFELYLDNCIILDT
jgi:hypothetical protein